MQKYLTLALILAVAAPAQAFNRPYRMQVTALGGPDFRVEFAPRADDTDYWCAAASYVKQRLGMGNKTRIYRLTPEPRKRGQGISFTLDKARSTGSSGVTVYGGEQDGGLSAGSAYQFCTYFEDDSFGFAN